MSLLVLHHERDRYAAEIVATALRRSFTSAQVASATYDSAAEAAPPQAGVLINPGSEAAGLLKALLTAGRKGLVLGRIPRAMGEALGIEVRDEPPLEPSLAVAPVDHARHHDESAAAVQYTGHLLALASPLARRPLCRFDFQNEWNNLGYGRITADGGPWSLAVSAAAAGAAPIAWLTAGSPGNGEPVGTAKSVGIEKLYAALCETSSGAVLWFNRAVGPVDSGEWRIVETFFGDYRAEELAALPYVSELPAGYAAGVTMRLDCDEAIASARPLLELYADAGLPLSLAVPTARAFEPADVAVLRDVLRAGGSLAPHSVQHRPNWGGSYSAALDEAVRCRAALEPHAAGPIHYAVSPFHQNPIYAVHALADSGYRGFVGGIIANDPEFLLGRAGQVPFVEAPLVSHSAQCMLHGDCYQRYGRSVAPYQESFENHCRARSLFGYLDHPFSARYQYGWSDEPTRVDAHRRLLDCIGRVPDLWRPNLCTALDFLSRRNRVRLRVEQGTRLVWEGVGGDSSQLSLAACWKGREIVATAHAN